jgi:hypothetical protein
VKELASGDGNGNEIGNGNGNGMGNGDTDGDEDWMTSEPDGPATGSRARLRSHLAAQDHSLSCCRARTVRRRVASCSCTCDPRAPAKRAAASSSRRPS